MKILILGGTRFFGRHLTEIALARGHDIMLFNRGETDPDAFPQVEHLRGDRNNQGGLDALKGRSWDAVIDTSGYVPRQVKESAELLAEACEHYTFISTILVYQDTVQRGITEDFPLKILDDEIAKKEEVTPESYGGLKVLCEQVLRSVLPTQALILRPGVIVGPYDYTYRFNYWLVNVAEGDEVLAPGDPQAPIQFIDVRDLANWTIDMLESKNIGIYNTVGPGQNLTFEQFLIACQNDISSDATFTWVSEEFLLEQGITPFRQMPFWVLKDEIGIMAVSSEKAVQAGLTYRPLEEIILDTLPYAQQQAKTLDPNKPWKYGLTSEQEDELLAIWHCR